MPDIFDEISALAQEGALPDMTAEQERAEIRRLSEQRQALKEVERLMRNGRPVPPLLREKALGK